ncbi:MAG: discoidin domain-containing protein [Kiritimatiellae bacterium]|jgi:hypothetical protein|nr:discoidin domain-containing protein [Kiritimatiellia bacterium]
MKHIFLNQRNKNHTCRPAVSRHSHATADALTGRWVRRVGAPGLQKTVLAGLLSLAYSLPAMQGAAPDSACFINVPRPPAPGSFSTTTQDMTAAKTDSAGLENLALRKQAKPSASGLLPGYAAHRIKHLNDGKLGNSHSWISDSSTGWAEINLGEAFHICRVAFGSDSTGKYRDRALTSFDIEVTSESGADAQWRTVYSYSGSAVHQWTAFTFPPAEAKRIRINIRSCNNSQPRIEEIGVFGSTGPITTQQVGSLSIDARNSGTSDYAAQLRMAILGEEHAWLKTYGIADVEYRLRRTPYPEKRMPRHADDDLLPLPTLTTAPKLDGQPDDPAWQAASRGVARVCHIDSWENGPLVEQAVEAGICGTNLYLSITANRFLSTHLALVGVVNQPNRGLIIRTRTGFRWQPLDPTGKPAGDSVTLPGTFDEKNQRIETRLPLSSLPDYKKSGLYIGAGIGGRWTHPGGRPVNFFPAPFSLRQAGSFSENAFTLRILFNSTHLNLIVKSDADSSVHEVRYRFLPDESQDIKVRSRQGPVGPEAKITIDDQWGNTWKMSFLRYTPSARPLTLYRELINRRQSNGEKTADAEKQLADFQKRHTAILKSGTTDISAERALLWNICAAKRALFLHDKELAPVTKLLFSKRHPFHPSHNYSVQFDSPWRPGGGVWTLDMPMENGCLVPEKAQPKQLFDAGNGVARDPSVSFDATKFYYGYRSEKSEYYRIFEQDLATGTRRRISPDGPFHDFWPTPLPDGGMAFITTRCKKKFICWRPQAAVLFRMELDGSKVEPLSYANLTEFAPSVLDDGRILWTRSEYVDKGADYGHTLWTIRADGTFPELTFGNTIALPQGFANARQMPETREVCAIMISHFGDLNGPIALLDQKKGPHDSAAISNLTPEIPWPGYSPNSEVFREPLPVTRDVILVAHAPQDRFGLYLIDRYGNREMLYMDSGIDSICPLTLRPRPLPPVMHGAAIPALVKMNKGQFSVENVYRGLEGQVEPGAAKYLRICEELGTPLRKLPDGTYQADHTPFMKWYASPVDLIRGPFGWPSYVAKGVIGTVPVEADGSANFLAPAEKVIYLELLDENYNEIQRMRSVVQLRPGEQRSCIGCHESRLITPDRTYLKMQAMKKAPAEPTPPPWGAGPFWFESVVQPVLDTKCISCHNAKTPNKIDLTETRDKENIPRSYRNLINSGSIHYFDYGYQRGVPYKAAPYSFGTHKSSIWKILKDKNHKDVKLTQNQERAIKCWTDLNVPLWGDYAFRPERKDVRPQDKNRWKPN